MTVEKQTVARQGWRASSPSGMSLWACLRSTVASVQKPTDALLQNEYLELSSTGFTNNQYQRSEGDGTKRGIPYDNSGSAVYQRRICPLKK